MQKYRPKDLTDWTIGDVQSGDYPDFCDAFLEEAWVGTRSLSEAELEYITDYYPEWINEQAFESLL